MLGTGAFAWCSEPLSGQFSFLTSDPKILHPYAKSFPANGNNKQKIRGSHGDGWSGRRGRWGTRPLILKEPLEEEIDTPAKSFPVREFCITTAIGNRSAECTENTQEHLRRQVGIDRAELPQLYPLLNQGGKHRNTPLPQLMQPFPGCGGRINILIPEKAGQGGVLFDKVEVGGGNSNDYIPN